MESIVLHSDIARLVLGYLVNNNLKRAALTLCRTSPHLHQEFVAFRQGLQPHNFLNGGLEEMIREHVKITGMVANAVHKLPLERRLRLQQLKLSERLGDLLKLDKSTSTSARDSACPRNANTNTQRKRRRMRGHAMLSDEELPGSCKRPRLLAPHLYCSIERSCRNLSDDNDSLESSTGSDMSSAQTDDGLSFHGRGPKNNSTPRTATTNDAELVMPMPQAMPALTQAIMTNEDFQQKLLNNINVALQSVTVHAPTVESVNSEAVLDDLVKNILEATEKDPSFDRVLQEVVGIETPQVAGNPTAPGALIGTAGTAMTSEAAPPQTPLIIRNAVASANGSAVNGDVNVVNGSGNAVIQLNANSSIGTLIDPNFSISKLIVLNSNESAQKQQQAPAVNLSFTTENLINFADGGAALTDADAVGNQVCVDATNGQLTFPMFLSNDGLFSHLPFLVNNEWLAQQLRSDVFANGDVSHIEIPLPEPITVAANQLPPNSIIINSAVKHPLPPASVEPPVQLIEEPPKPLTADAPQLERSASKLPSGNAVPASLDSSRLVQERVTPSTSGIVNVKAFRSLSTPRKRTSHVRTLNFSPKAVTQLHNTPVSTRRAQLQHQRQQRRIKQKALKEQQTEEHDKPDKPIIIKNVEILPKFGSSPNQAVVEVEEVAESAAAGTGTVGGGGGGVSGGSADMSANESNSCVPPLFAMEEGSNQTVIKAATASKTTAPIVAATPKRKQKRRAAVKACKRIISQAVVVEEPILDAQQPQQEQEQQEELDASVSTSLDDSKENQIVAVQVPEEQDDMMAAWQRQLHGKSSTDLEHRLREINAKRQETLKGQPRVRRKKKALNTPLSNKLKKLKTPPSGKKKKQKELQEKQAKQEKTGQSANVEGEFNIKIPTPQKQKRSTQTKESKLMKEGKQMKELEEPQQPQEQQQQPQPQPQEEKQPQPQPEPLEQEVVQEQVEDLPAPVQLEQLKESIDVPSLSALLETPYKVMIMDAGEVPPTPGPTLIPPLATPYAKLLPSASFLFGSDTKSLLDTPMLTAITPGMRLGTPFGHSLGTPHSSAAKTDYSSGSSYYRPDEAEHTDTNAQCALQPAMSPHNDVEQTIKLSSACLELYAERLPVEPTVLRRVRSFGTEAVDSAEGAAAILPNVEPAMVELAHYKLVSGLPDAVVDNSSSSSCASSSTFSSSSSSSSSGSASSSNSNSSNSSAGSSSAPSSQMANTVLPAKTIQLLDMQNLSDISSTEDEEWLKAAAAAAPQHASPLAIDSEPAQLVSQDGEVRYPLRNWLTPSKDAAAAADTSGEMAPPAALPMPPAAAIAALPAPPPPPPTLSAPVTPPPPPAPQTPPPPPPADPPSSSTESPAPTAPAATVADEKLNQELAMEQLRQDLAKVRERVKAKVKQQPTPKARRRNTNKKLTAMRETAKLANPTSSAAKSPKKQAKAGQKVSAEMAKKAAAGAVGAAGATAEAVEAGAAVEGGSIEAEAIAGAEREAEGTEVTETVDAGPGAADVATADGAAEQLSTAGASPLGAALSHETPSEMMPSSSDLDPALLMALNLSAKKQQMQPKTGRVAVEIAAQPAPTTLSTGARRGRPKKPLITEPARLSMRRSSRLIDNKTPAPEDSQAEATTRLAKSSSNAKVTKKPAKKRAEARLETAAPTLATLAEAQTTQQSPEQQPASSVSNGDYELDMYRSISHVENTYSFAYADDGSKPTQPVSRQPPSYFKNFQMRIMVDSGEMHSIRITCPQLLHHSPSADEDYAGSAASIKNIPKKRKPVAASTPLANDVNADEEEERDDDDLEVATINTPMKMNSSDDLAMEPHDAGVQIEDIESILSHLHGT